MKRALTIILPMIFFSMASLAGPMTASVEKSSAAFSSLVSTAPVKSITFPVVVNNAFRAGEKLIFSIKYEFIAAGTATMEVADGPVLDGRPTLSIHSRAESNGFVDSFFIVRDFNASMVDRASLVSRNFHQNLKEGHYSVIRNTAINYNTRAYTFQRIRKGKTTERSGTIETPVYDILSAFYLARTLPLEKGGKYEITVFSDEDIYQLVINVHPKTHNIHVAAGRFECLRLDPIVLGDGIFKAKEGKMQLYLTNDERKMPVMIRSKVFIGAFDAELASFEPK